MSVNQPNSVTDGVPEETDETPQGRNVLAGMPVPGNVKVLAAAVAALAAFGGVMAGVFAGKTIRKVVRRVRS